MSRLKVEDTVRFQEPSGKWWTGVVTAVWPDEVYVRWSDGLVGIFKRCHESFLEKVGSQS